MTGSSVLLIFELADEVTIDEATASDFMAADASNREDTGKIKFAAVVGAGIKTAAGATAVAASDLMGLLQTDANGSFVLNQVTLANITDGLRLATTDQAGIMSADDKRRLDDNTISTFFFDGGRADSVYNTTITFDGGGAEV